MELEPFITAHILLNGNDSFRFSSGYYGFNIKFIINKNLTIVIKTDDYRKRIGLDININNKGKEFFNFLHKKHNLVQSKKHYSYHFNFDFKYSSRICHKIAMVIRDCITFSNEFGV